MNWSLILSIAALALLALISLAGTRVILSRLGKVSSAILGSGDTADEGRRLPSREVVRCSADWHTPSHVQQERTAAPGADGAANSAAKAKLDNNDAAMVRPRDAEGPFVVNASCVSLRDATPSEVDPSLSEQMEKIATSVIRKAMEPGGLLWRSRR
ncbi:hypothetical protein [Xylophilus sp.]|uniref:hypothetical protein n=1 Tax=Xylophilus sp. TaxID=2653893 RepID=UPI0013BB797F|nr:hypothetical protein [Xylophilus sp.]KAF1045633.1 MAG: hypothetical protein GAK38_02925 [Xylophilus sp.]